MDEIRATIFLENQRDRILAEAGHLLLDQIRRVRVDALVDTGAVMTLLPQDVVENLGLSIDGNIIVTLANEEKIELPRARFLSLTIANRQMDTDCLVGPVGPPQCEPLIGQLVLERLDLVLDPLNRTIAPARIAVPALTETEVNSGAEAESMIDLPLRLESGS